MANTTGFCVDMMNRRVMPEGPITVESCTHRVLLTDPCDHCELVIAACDRAWEAI